MTTLSDIGLTSRSNEITLVTRHMDGRLQLDVPLDALPRSPESKAHWTDGAIALIEEKLRLLVADFERDLDRLKKELDWKKKMTKWKFTELAFYADKEYLENELAELSKRPLPFTTESITSIVTISRPVRRRGRPPTGGRQPRDRRVNALDDEYEP